METEVIKRNGTKVAFDEKKITSAIKKAMIDTYGTIDEEHCSFAEKTSKEIKNSNKNNMSVEDIQVAIIKKLMASKYKDVAIKYVEYRYERNKQRVIQDDLDRRYREFKNLVTGKDEEANKENSNKDTRIIPTMRDYIAGSTCKEIANHMIPKDIWDAHKNGIIHFHDTDYSPALPMHNCDLINLEDMLNNGTVISGKKISKPHKFSTACNIGCQIITQVASSQYGGNTISIGHLSPFVNETRKFIREKHPTLTNEEIEDFVEEDIIAGIQTIQYQLITMSTTNGQSPFTSIMLYIDEIDDERIKKDHVRVIEEVLRQRIAGIPNENGYPVTVAFPKLLYVLDENNIHDDSEYFWLTKLAAECSAKRLVPDYVSAKKAKELKEGHVIPPMGCRSFLSPWYDEDGNFKMWGRFNKGVCTINLPHVALSSNKDFDRFWEIFDERLELCHKALLIRYNSLKGTKSDVAPILWQHGALTRLKPGETIDKYLVGGYSTISLGYAGLYECIKYMTGESQLNTNGYEFGIQIMKHMKEKCDQWDSELKLGFSPYGTPIESTTEKFAKANQRDFGIIAGITDKLYVTNSYHITPRQEIDAFSKLSIESDFAKYSTGGMISYIETPNMEKNIPAIIEILRHIYDTIMYAEINTMTSYCHECGCTDIYMGDDLQFHCPNCGNDNYDKMDVAVRICGYISTNPFNDGRAEDIHDRVYHLGAD